MKIIVIDTPNGQYSLPLQKVAEHRASEYYNPKLQSKLWEKEVDFVMNDDFEGIDWLVNNTNYEDWEEETTKLNNEVNFAREDFWCSSDGFLIKNN